MSKTVTPKHPCTNCGKLGTAATMVFSTYTHNRYCRDLDGCRKRRLRRQRKESA